MKQALAAKQGSGVPGAALGSPQRSAAGELRDRLFKESTQDTRSGAFPADDGGFFEEECFLYDLDIQAVIGHEFIDDGFGNCIQVPTGRDATEDIWGWHSTSLEIGASVGLRPALTSSVTMSGSDWLYGPWTLVSPVCSQPNMAFELLTEIPR